MNAIEISLIAAIAENGVIGRDGGIPWDLPEDRRHFREITWGHPVIMGRKTFESIGHSLPGRKNIVLTRQERYIAEGCVVASDLRSALETCAGSDEILICGGGEVFRQALPLADRIYLTIVHIDVMGDTFFPHIPAEEFLEKERRAVRGSPSYDFVMYERTGAATAGKTELPAADMADCRSMEEVQREESGS